MKQNPVIEKMVSIINSYTEHFCITTTRSGDLTACMLYGTITKRIDGFYNTRDKIIIHAYNKLKGDLWQECCMIERFNGILNKLIL